MIDATELVCVRDEDDVRDGSRVKVLVCPRNLFGWGKCRKGGVMETSSPDAAAVLAAFHAALNDIEDVASWESRAAASPAIRSLARARATTSGDAQLADVVESLPVAAAHSARASSRMSPSSGTISLPVVSSPQATGWTEDRHRRTEATAARAGRGHTAARSSQSSPARSRRRDQPATPPRPDQIAGRWQGEPRRRSPLLRTR